MQPSSLIFVAIVAIWAAYLIQHWVQRREHLATARSLDRFSEAMRVLDRHRPVIVAASTRSYSVSPIRPHALSGRADMSTAGATGAAAGSPVASPAPDTAGTTAIQGAPGTAGRAEPADPSPVEAVMKPVARPSLRSAPRALASAPVRLASLPMRLLAGTTMRRIRAVTLLLALVALPVTIVLAVVRPLLWMAPLIALAVLALDVAWLRHAARTSRRARVAARVNRARLAEAGSAESRVSFTPVGPVEAAKVEPAAVSAAAPVSAPGSWQPVPVPPPTYTLKARAPERVTVGASMVPLAASQAAVYPQSGDRVFDQTVRTDLHHAADGDSDSDSGIDSDEQETARRSAAG